MKSTPSSISTALSLKSDKINRSSTKPFYVALGVNIEGQKELLGMTEGAKFWLAVLAELLNRGVKDNLIACVDDLKAFPDAINTVLPNTQIQLSIVHMVRNSVNYVPWKDYKAVTADLKKIYQSKTEDEALLTLEQFSDKWDDKYPQISRSWTAH